jgi:hypothetical protein
MTINRTNMIKGTKPSVFRRTVGTAAIIGALVFVGFSPSAFAQTGYPEGGPIGESPATEPTPVDVVDLVGEAVMPDTNGGVSQATPQIIVDPVVVAAPSAPMLPATGSGMLVVEAMAATALVGLGMMARRTATA